MSQRVGHNIFRLPLDNGQVADLIGDSGCHLNPATGAADQHHLLAFQVDVRIPLCGMHDGTPELVQILHIGEIGGIIRPYRPDNEVGLVTLRLFPLPCFDHPQVALLIPSRAAHRSVELDLRTKAVFVGNVLDIVQKLRPSRVEACPVGIRVEGVGIAAAGRIDGSARITGFQPVAPDVAMLLKDREVESRLL